MNIEEFWQIVELVHQKSNGDMDAKCQFLGSELLRLTSIEIQSFDQHFTDCFYKAYTHDIWGAAFIINNGCSDDSFMDFRSTLISLGRKPFETTLACADSLADFDIDPAWAAYEGYQYVAPEIYERVVGARWDRNLKPEHPRNPAGVPFKEWQMSERFPRLAAKYGYKESDWLCLKVAEEKQAEAEVMGEKIKTILLEAGIIPSCGLIPPPRVVEEIIRAGKAPKSSGHELAWQPFDYDERYYWNAVAMLEKTKTTELKSRPDLKKVILKLDLNSLGAEQFEQWIESLRQRKLI